jgi:HK97 family phage major capsid protein
MHPRTWGTLARIKEASGSAKPVLTSEVGPTGGITRSLYGVPVLLTSQISTAETQGTATNASSAYVVDADQLVLVVRNDLQVEVDGSVAFRTDQSVVRGVARADFVVANPAGVVRIVGLLP